jgi:DegV family protein with EDD domain
MSTKIATDSTCDLPDQVVAEYDISVVPCFVNIGNQSYLDGVELSRQEFYQRLPSCETLPTTSAPGIGAFVQLYEQLAAGGAAGIISIHVSANLSNILNSAQLAAERANAVPVTVIDSGQLSLGTGLLVLAAAEAAVTGHSMADIIALLKAKSPQVYSFAALDTLEYLRRSGRVTRLQSSLGSLLKVKPLLKVHAGELELERVRTRSKAMGWLVNVVSELGPLEQLGVVHTHAPDRAEELQNQVQHLIPASGRQLCEEVTPAIGAHVGPGAVGLVAMQM